MHWPLEGPRLEVQGKRGTWWLCGSVPMILGLCLCGGTKQKPGGVQDGDCQHVCFAKVQGRFAV